MEWLEEWKEDNDFISITHSDCKSKEVYFEIMVGLQGIKVAGCHREDKKFYYEVEGCRKLIQPAFMVENGLYNKLINEVFKDLLFDFEEIKKLRKLQQKTRDPFHKRLGVTSSNKEATTTNLSSINTLSLADYLINSIVLWAKRFYTPGNRYEFMFPFLGTLCTKIC